MIGITRYHISDGNHPSVEYVTYEDHLARVAALEAALREERCPRPINGATDESIGWCVNTDHCGCKYRRLLTSLETACQHDLQKPECTVKVTDKGTRATCSECREVWTMPEFQSKIGEK
jgi:hypothetical protein